MISQFATRAEAADRRGKDAEALNKTIQARIDEVSGVNLDEEFGKMILFQNAYTASARMITTARQLFDVLVAMAG